MLTSTPNHTPHYPHDPYCEHRNCPDCAVNVLRIMLREQHNRDRRERSTTTPAAWRRAARFRPMGVR